MIRPSGADDYFRYRLDRGPPGAAFGAGVCSNARVVEDIRRAVGINGRAGGDNDAGVEDICRAVDDSDGTAEDNRRAVCLNGGTVGDNARAVWINGGAVEANGRAV